MENITHMSQIVQDAVFEPFIGEELPHVLNHIINYGQVEFGLQLFTDTKSEAVQLLVIHHNLFVYVLINYAPNSI